jgi:phosphoribosylaminoimidazole (AIR) synthetase
MGIGLVIMVNPNEKNRVLNLLEKGSCTEIGVAIKDESNSVFLNEK